MDGDIKWGIQGDEKQDINENKIEEDTSELSIEDFEIDIDYNKKSQALFHFSLSELLDIYNKNKEKAKNIGIYLIKEKNVMLVNIPDQIVEKFFSV